MEPLQFNSPNLYTPVTGRPQDHVQLEQNANKWLGLVIYSLYKNETKFSLNALCTLALYFLILDGKRVTFPHGNTLASSLVINELCMWKTISGLTIMFY